MSKLISVGDLGAIDAFRLISRLAQACRLDVWQRKCGDRNLLVYGSGRHEVLSSLDTDTLGHYQDFEESRNSSRLLDRKNFPLPLNYGHRLELYIEASPFKPGTKVFSISHSALIFAYT